MQYTHGAALVFSKLIYQDIKQTLSDI